VASKGLVTTLTEFVLKQTCTDFPKVLWLFQNCMCQNCDMKTRCHSTRGIRYGDLEPRIWPTYYK